MRPTSNAIVTFLCFFGFTLLPYASDPGPADVADATDPVLSGVVQNAFGHRRLTGINVGHNTYITRTR